MFYLVIGYVYLFFQGIIITLLFNQLNVVSLQRKFIMLLSISMCFTYGWWGCLIYTIIFSMIITHLSQKKIPILLSMFYVSYLLVSTAIIYQLLDNVLALIEGNYTAMIMFELIILPWIVFYLQTSLLYYFKRYLVYFVNHILAKYRFQAALLDVTLLSYIYLRFSDLPNRLLIASIILVVIAAYIYCITLYSQKQAIKLAQAEQLQNLIEYTAQIEELYDKLRRFKHDYKNILLSLEYCLDNDDLAGAKKVYHQAIAPTRSIISPELQLISQLQNISDPALKGILSNKLALALAKNLRVTCEIAQKITLDPRVTQLDMVRLLSIFMDNAIEAAYQVNKGCLDFAFFEHDNEQFIVIRNSTKYEKIELQLLDKVGYTTKNSQGHGYGLANVSAILRDYPFISLNTSSSHYIFQQELIITGGYQDEHCYFRR